MYLFLICLNQEYEEKNEPTEEQEEAPPPETEKPEEDEKQPPEEEQPPEPEPILEAEPQPATMGDLLGLDEINPAAAELEQSNALALAIISPDHGLTSHATYPPNFSAPVAITSFVVPEEQRTAFLYSLPMAEEPDAGPSNPRSPPPSSDEGLGKPQVPYISGFQMYPFICTIPFPSQNLEEDDNGPGIYAIPCLPYMNPTAGFSPNTLIPLRYKIPT
ncbi:hypothetical protein BHM03_00033478 [Ensete ventricosum]|nr:hypothetical protein BHM03_00033478 [Ensete ventricosum]